MYKWQQKIIENVEDMSNRELFNAFVNTEPYPDDGRDAWEREYLQKEMVTRLASWLLITKPNICPKCNGKGYHGSAWFPRPCLDCKGTGKTKDIK